MNRLARTRTPLGLGPGPRRSPVPWGGPDSAAAARETQSRHGVRLTVAADRGPRRSGPVAAAAAGAGAEAAGA